MRRFRTVSRRIYNWSFHEDHAIQVGGNQIKFKALLFCHSGWEKLL